MTRTKLTADQIAGIENEIRKATRERMDFDEWWRQKSMNFRVENKNLKAELKREFMSEQANVVAELPDVTRCVLYVYGDTNTGKSYATRQYFRQLYGSKPGRVVEAAGQGSGVFDEVTLGTDATIFDDIWKGNVPVKDMLRLCKDGKQPVHRRYKGDVAYIGKYTVIVTLASPQEWLKELGSTYWDKKNGRPTDIGAALLERLTQVHVHEAGDDIVVDPPVYSTCGMDEALHEKKMLADRYVAFLRKSCHYYATHGNRACKVSDVANPADEEIYKRMMA